MGGRVRTANQNFTPKNNAHLSITNCNRAWFAKLATRGFQEESGDVRNHPQEVLAQLHPAYKLGQGLEDCEKGYCVAEEIVER